MNTQQHQQPEFAPTATTDFGLTTPAELEEYRRQCSDFWSPVAAKERIAEARRREFLTKAVQMAEAKERAR
jgi:hypothetical protein